MGWQAGRFDNHEAYYVNVPGGVRMVCDCYAGPGLDGRPVGRWESDVASIEDDVDGVDFSHPFAQASDGYYPALNEAWAEHLAQCDEGGYPCGRLGCTARARVGSGFLIRREGVWGIGRREQFACGPDHLGWVVAPDAAGGGAETFTIERLRDEEDEG